MFEESIPSEQHCDFWEADSLFRAIVEASLPSDTWPQALPALASMGRRAGIEAAPLAAVADRLSPRLVTHDPQGRRIDHVEYHPSYRQMEEIAYGGGCVAVKYEEGPLRSCRHRIGFALGYLFGQAESGLFCPVCMTDGVARVLEKFGSEEQQRSHIPRLAARDTRTLARGAMFLTEKQGGSDVGATATRAVRDGDGWRLDGEKWFCSNVDAELCLTLARPEGAVDGTKGLGLFLMARDLPDGSRNGYRIDRIKDKLGVRSMPTGEVTLEGARAEQVGKIDRGFAMMAEMLNLSRLYNSIASIAVLRRAALEARRYTSRRHAFGRPVIDHPLARVALESVEDALLGSTLVVWRVVTLLDAADGGDRRAASLVRSLTPLIKYSTAKIAVAGVSECLELHGGQGYIEESVMPRLLRDAQVLPIWEGTTNILVLDTIRALRREESGEALLELGKSDGEPVALASARDGLRRDMAAAVSGSYPEEQLRGLTDRLMRVLTMGELARARAVPALAAGCERALRATGG